MFALRSYPALLSVQFLTDRAVTPAFAARRCLVPVDAWYEWQVTPKGKQPFAFARPDRETMAFAGIWESWVTPGTAKVLRTFAIITTAANATAAPVHDRMPVIIRQ
ncbi:SOS response-associated peptidase family protein, partial [Acidiphilium multivorum]